MAGRAAQGRWAALAEREASVQALGPAEKPVWAVSAQPRERAALVEKEASVQALGPVEKQVSAGPVERPVPVAKEGPAVSAQPRGRAAPVAKEASGVQRVAPRHRWLMLAWIKR